MATDGWPIAKLGDVVANHDSRRIPLSSRERATRQGRFPYYGAAGVIDFVDRPIFSGLHLLVGEDGSVVREDGRPFLQLADGEFWVNNHAHVLTGETDIETRFIYYALSNTNIRGWVTGAVQPKLNQGNMNQIEIPFPEEGVRRAVVSVLGSLDDKIEVNRKHARVLEGIARAMFNSWFVDFDPVRRKAAGEPTGLPDEIAALFPDRLVGSSIGQVPDSWSVRSLPDAVEVNPTRTLKRGEVAPYLDMSNMPTHGHAPAQWVQREAGSGMRFKNGDTLVARITPCLENGKTAFVDFLDNGEVAWGSTEYIVLRPRAPLPPVFAYLLARSDRFRTFAIQAMTGSSGRQRVPADNLAHFLLAVPPGTDNRIATRFGTVVEPLFARMSTAMAQSRTLGALRDALLPKLISGELRIADAEHIVGRAV